MPLSIRLSDKADGILEEWVEEGLFESKAEAVRTALNLLSRVQEAKSEGYHVVALTPEAIKEMNLAVEIA